jgi:hypothetical protein
MNNKIALLMASVLGFAASSFAGPYDAWTYHRDITVNTTGTGADVAGTVANFPVLVRLTNVSAATGADVLFSALPNGADVRFTNADGSAAYAYEIDSWSATAAIVWVKVPSIAGNGNTVLRMYWGKAGELNASSSGAVFDTSNGYVGVWHMGGAANATDATFNGFTGTNVGTTAVAGHLGGGRGLDGSTQYVSVPQNNKLDIPTAFTLSAWVNAASWDGGSKRIVHKGIGSGGSLNAGQYGLRDNSNNSLQTDVANTGGNAQTPAPAVGEWHLVHGTYGDGSERTYVDGIQGGVSTSTTGTIAAEVSELAIGREPEVSDANLYFNGILDEVRVQNVTRSADWIKLENETQKAGATAVNLGTSQPPVAIRQPANRPRLGSGANGHSFEIPASIAADKATMTVMDAHGRAVWSNSIRPSETQRVLAWNGKTANGAKASAGVYMITVTALNGAQSTRLLEEAVTLNP